MKKIILLSMCFIFSTSCAWAQPEELRRAKNVIASACYNLRDNSKRLDFILLNKRFSKIQTLFILQAKSNINLAAQVTSGIISIYTLQSVQKSVPDRAKEILRTNSYNAVNSLDLSHDSLGVLIEEIKDKDVKLIILSSADFIEKSKQSIQIILKYQEKGIFLKDL